MCAAIIIAARRAITARTAIAIGIIAITGMHNRSTISRITFISAGTAAAIIGTTGTGNHKN
jgi:hypothetical protein